MTLFHDPVLQRRQRELAATWANLDAVALVCAGEPIGKPGGQDQTYDFIPHPEYYWLTGSDRWGGVMAFEPGVGFVHFVRPVDAAELLWEGEPEVPAGRDRLELEEWLDERSDQRVVWLGQPPARAARDSELEQLARDRLDSVRRRKDAAEIEHLRGAIRATAAGHAKARELIRPGVSERAVQIEMEAEMFRHGATGTGYGSIVGAGTRAAVLHSTPGARLIAEGELVLVDAGAEIRGYTADVTRTYPAGARFTAEQQAIYDIVLAAELAGIEACTVGREWHDVHRTSARVMAQGLVDLGILRGSVDGLLESGAIALFFPHGIGHMVGLGVRDVGGRSAGRPEGRRSCGARVRVDLPLEAGFLMTVEPGLYFVPAILDDPVQRIAFPDAVAWDQLGRWIPVGGVRIEDNILVSAEGPQNLTAEIPK